MIELDSMDWTKSPDALLPAIVQDAKTLRVLMLGYMSREALMITLASGHVTFFSRSRQCLWTKGETSGHVLELVSIDIDCDADTLLILARPCGPTCHLGRSSCFADAPANHLGALDALIASREKERPTDSYTTRLFDAGIRRIAQKVGEEGVETALAAVAQEDDELLCEAADLVFHLLVLLRARGLGLNDLIAKLDQRASATAPSAQD